MTDAPATLYHRTGPDTFAATEACRGPWDPAAMHGGPAALVAVHAIEQTLAEAIDGVDFFPSRTTVELLRPVPLEELTVQATVRRPGKRICVVDATVARADGTVCLAATTSAIRVRPFGQVHPFAGEPPRRPGASPLVHFPDRGGPPMVTYGGDAVDKRDASGTFADRGPSTMWFRLRTAVVDDEPVTPLERVFAAADFPNGISSWFLFDDALYINPDLNVQLYRLPVGEWVGVEARTALGAAGVGLAEAVLWDEDGPIGRATQSLLVEER